MNNSVDKQKQFLKIQGVDALGNEIRTNGTVRSDRYVGIFYFFFRGTSFNGKTMRDPANDPNRNHRIYDVEKMLATEPDLLWDDTPLNDGPVYCTEPLYGYYNPGDPWVIRKHLELFIEAGIDFVAFDYTNGETYPEQLKTYLNLSLEYLKNGWNVPKICFFTNFTHFGGYKEKSLLKYLYEKVYSDEKYRDLWFYGPYDKPLMIGYPDKFASPAAYYVIDQATGIPEGYERLSPEIVDFFHWRKPQWPTQRYEENGFPYISIERPQRVYTDTMSVSVAQLSAGAMSWAEHPPKPFEGMFTNQTKGRGWSDRDGANVKENVPYDTNYQEQWDVAKTVDPQIVFLTGWNEWGAGKLFWTRDGHTTPTYCDSFNVEYSRDIEMMKNGIGDSTFMKTVQNIRRFKECADGGNIGFGVDIGCAENPQWIWEDGIAYYGRPFAKSERDSVGAHGIGEYKIPKPENPVEEIRVAHSSENIYFYIKTTEEIKPCPADRTNWMNLFIRVNGLDAQSWEGFHYVLNRHPNQSGKTSLEVCMGGYNFIRKADVDCKIVGNKMEIRIPKSELRIKGSGVSISFKYADGVECENDILDYYVTGDVLPLGRLSYSYEY